MIKIKSSLTNDNLLKKALTKMGLTFEEGNFKITQYGQTEKAQIKFENALGLQKQEDGTWSLVGDPYHCSNQKLRKYYGHTNLFNTEVQTAYTVVETKQKMEEMNFVCTENEQGNVGQNQKIKMVFQYLGG